MFFRYFIAGLRAFAVSSGFVRGAGARRLACGILSMCVDVSVSGNRCRCSVRSLGYVHSGEADFEGSVCLPEDCTVTFKFSRTGLWHVELMSRVHFLSTGLRCPVVAWLRCQSVPSGPPVVVRWRARCSSVPVCCCAGLAVLGVFAVAGRFGAPAAPCCLSIGSTPAARLALWRVRDCTGGSCQLSRRSFHFSPLPCGVRPDA